MGDFSLLGLGDVTAANAGQIIGTDNGGGIHVNYDHDGNILRNFFGVNPASVLGISDIGYSAVGKPEIAEAFSVLSGPGVRSTDTNGVGFAGVFTHEFGHTPNLAHTTTNGQTGSPNNDQPQPRDCAAPWTGKPAPVTYETMYPLIEPLPGRSGEYMYTVERMDDIAALSNLYPEPGWPESWGTIHGKVRARSKATGNSPQDLYEVTGVNIIARRLDDPFADANSNTSGGLSQGRVGPDGAFEINGLTPGADYLLYVDNFLTGGYSTPKLLVLPGPEEYFNGANESGDGLADDRCAWTPIRVAAGSPVSAGITFNRVKGAPEFIAQPSPGIATDISADGNIVVGALGVVGVYRWDVNAGTYEILPGGRPDGNPAISDDGARISANAQGADGIWSPAIYENGAWTTLPPPAGATTPCGTTNRSWGTAWDISGDGSTVVGFAYTNGCTISGIRASKWTAATGTVLLPKYDSPTTLNRANGVKYDGLVIVGRDDAETGPAPRTRGAFWSGGTVALVQPDPLQTPASEAFDVTRDGRTIVGSHHANDAWSYSQREGLVDLGTFSGARSFGYGASDDDRRREAAAGPLDGDRLPVAGAIALVSGCRYLPPVRYTAGDRTPDAAAGDRRGRRRAGASARPVKRVGGPGSQGPSWWQLLTARTW